MTLDDRLSEARRRFDAIVKGRYVPRRTSLEVAKRRLRETDPGIDMSELLHALNEGDIKGAGASLLWQTLAPETIAYFTPLIVSTIESVMAASQKKNPEKS